MLARMIKGGKPSELPVQARVKFELEIKTANELGLEVPILLQQRAAM